MSAGSLERQVERLRAANRSATSARSAVLPSDPPRWKKRSGGGHLQPSSIIHRTTVSLTAITAVAVFDGCAHRSPSVPSATRVGITLPAGDQFSSAGRHVVALSPDGTRMAYVANQRLFVRALHESKAVPLRGTEGTGTMAGRSPFFSPDGQWIGFWQDGHLKKISISGGSPVVLCAAQNPWGASWAADNTILYGQGAAGIWRVSGDGGRPENVIKVEPGQVAHGPQLLPDGRAILYTLADTDDGWDAAQIVVWSFGTRTHRAVVKGGTDARYASSGHLVYAIGNTLLAVPFDAETFAVTAAPISFVDGVARADVTGAAHYAISTEGALIYVPTDSLGAAPPRTLVWVDRHGREEEIKAPARPYFDPRISPDGTRVALEIQDQERDIWILDLTDGTLTRVTSGPAVDFPAIWTPDGRSLIFSSGRSGRNTIDPRNLFLQAVGGEGPVEQLTQGAVRQVPYAVTPDGTGLIFRDHSTDPGADPGDLRLLSLAGQRRSQTLVQTGSLEANAELSLDGHWLAYQSNESGQDEIYVRPFPNVAGGKWQVSPSGGARPLWGRDGRELFYESRRALMRIPITTVPTFQAGPPSKLFDGPYFYGALERTYDVSPDGRRFLMIKESGGRVESAASARLVLLPHWFEELKRRLPSK
jgi:Tol biopolymer transport system component